VAEAAAAAEVVVVVAEAEEVADGKCGHRGIECVSRSYSFKYVVVLVRFARVVSI